MIFADRAVETETLFRRVIAGLPAEGSIWVAWPKRSSGVETDLNEDRLRELFLHTGMVDNRVCAIDETWSGGFASWSARRTGPSGERHNREAPRNLSSVIPSTTEELAAELERHDYLAADDLVVAIHLALHLGRPLFLEGEAGVGKTEVAKVLAAMTGEPLIRLQCYEGLDIGQALYEWDYARQMLEIRLIEARGAGATADSKDIMSREFLIARPLLQAIEASTAGRRAVLLIDELDRADEEFEAFLLELLSDFQVSIPEIGTITAETPPIVVLTSNRTREIHDALKRRCIYHWIDYPTPAVESAIVRRKVPGIEESLAANLAEAMERLRAMDLFKPPGVAETLDWAESLRLLRDGELTPELVDRTLGVVLKYKDDIDAVRHAGVDQLVG